MPVTRATPFNIIPHDMIQREMNLMKMMMIQRLMPRLRRRIRFLILRWKVSSLVPFLSFYFIIQVL